MRWIHASVSVNSVHDVDHGGDDCRLTWGPGPGWGRRTRAAPQRPSGSWGGAPPCGTDGGRRTHETRGSYSRSLLRHALTSPFSLSFHLCPLPRVLAPPFLIPNFVMKVACLTSSTISTQLLFSVFPPPFLSQILNILLIPFAFPSCLFYSLQYTLTLLSFILILLLHYCYSNYPLSVSSSPFSKKFSNGCLVESLLLVEKLSDGLSTSIHQLILHQVIDALQTKYIVQRM